MSDAPTATLPASMLAPDNDLDKAANTAKAGIEASEKRAEAAYTEKNSALQAQSDEIQKDRKATAQFSADNPFPNPHLKEWTEPPPKNDPLQSFGSWATAFGIVAGALTKTGLKSSLNAGAAAMNAIRKNDMDAYQEAKSVWKDNTEIVMKQAEWETKAYQNAFEIMKTDQAAGLSALQVAATQADNKLMLEQVRQGNLKAAYDISKGIADFHAQGPERLLRVQQLQNQVDDTMERTKLYAEWAQKNQDVAPEMRAQMRTQIMNPQFTINQAKTLAEGGGQVLLDPVTAKREGADYRLTGKMKSWGGGTRGAAIRKQVAEEAASQAEALGDTIGAAKLRQATLRSEGLALDQVTKQRSAVRQFEETAQKNGRVLLGLIDKVDSTGVPVMEAWIRNGRKSVGGSPDVAAFDAQLTAYIPEVAKILSNPNMSGVTTDSARAEASAMIPQNVTKAQLERIIPLLEADFGRRQQSIDDEMKAIGQNIQDISNTLSGGGQAAASVGPSNAGKPAATAVQHPPVPTGVPSDAVWSPSTKTFYWNENGVTKSKKAE